MDGCAVRRDLDYGRYHYAMVACSSANIYLQVVSLRLGAKPFAQVHTQ